MSGGGGPQPPLRTGMFRLALGILVVVFIISVILLVSEAIRSNISPLGVLVLLILFFVSLVTTLATTEIIPPQGMTWQHVRQPRILGAIGSLLMVSFGSLYAYLPLLAAKGGPDAALEQVKSLLTTISEDSAATRKSALEMEKGLKGKGIIAGVATLVEQRINGIWGQADCANIYRFTLSPAGAPSRALTVEPVRSAPGLAPYRGQFAFLSATDKFGGDGFAHSTLHTEEIQGLHKGYTVYFILERSGDVEKLLWRSKSEEQNQLTLIRCQE